MATFLAPRLDSQHHGSINTQPASTTKQGPSAEDWDRVRPIIKGLYIDEDCTLKDVMKIMAYQHGHKATVKMYKLRFIKWEFDKHNRESDMRFVVRKKIARDAESKKSTFLVRTKEVSAQEIDRYAQRKQAADPTFAAAPADMATPIHILCFTPPGSPYLGQAQDVPMLQARQHDLPIDKDISSTTLGKRRRSRSPNPVSSNADEAVSSARLGKRRRSISPSPVSPNALVTQQDYRRIRAWARSPSVPCVVMPPDNLWKYEMLFADIPSYVRGSVASGMWYPNGQGRLRTLKKKTINPDDFSNFCDEAVMYLSKSSAVQWRRLLSKAFSMLPTLLREAHPTLLPSLVDCLLAMGEDGFVGTAAMIQNHIAELARTILPEHVWRRICISLSQADPDHAEVLTRSWRCLTDATADVSGRFSWSVVVSEAGMIIRLYISTDPQRAEKLLRELLADYEQTTQKLDGTALYVMDRLASCLLNQGKYAEVELLVEDALWRAREAGYLSKGPQASLMKWLAWAQYKLFKNDAAEEIMWSAIALFAERHGTNNPHVIACCRELEGWLRGWGRHSEADELSVKMDEMIGQDEIDFETTVLSPT